MAPRLHQSSINSQAASIVLYAPEKHSKRAASQAAVEKCQLSLDLASAFAFGFRCFDGDKKRVSFVLDLGTFDELRVFCFIWEYSLVPMRCLIEYA
jgi:hypothetical protein